VNNDCYWKAAEERFPALTHVGGRKMEISPRDRGGNRPARTAVHAHAAANWSGHYERSLGILRANRRPHARELPWHLVATSLDTVRIVNISPQMPLSSPTNHRLLIRRERKIAKSEYYLRHGHPSVRMHRLGSHWTDFRENLYRWLLFKSVKKIQEWSTQL